MELFFFWCHQSFLPPWRKAKETKTISYLNQATKGDEIYLKCKYWKFVFIFVAEKRKFKLEELWKLFAMILMKICLNYLDIFHRNSREKGNILNRIKAANSLIYKFCLFNNLERGSCWEMMSCKELFYCILGKVCREGFKWEICENSGKFEGKKVVVHSYDS